MTESEVEQVVLNSVRKYTLNQSVTMESQFDADMNLTAPAKQMLFAFVAEAFNARGVSLPSHGFYLSDFVACATPGAVRDAVIGKMFGGRASKAKAGHGASHHTAAPAAAHAPAHASAHAPPPAAGAPQPATASEPAAAPAAATPEATAAAEPAAAPGAEPDKKAGAKKKPAAKKPPAKRIKRRPN